MIKSIRICPRCKSEDVKKETSSLSFLGGPEEWFCNNCGFREHLFPEIEINNKINKPKTNKK